MKIEKQVTNVEISKKIYDLGVEYPSYFFWKFIKSKCSGKNHPVSEHPKKFIIIRSTDMQSCDPASMSHFAKLRADGDLFPAYTVAELGDMLPKYVMTSKTTVHVTENEDNVRMSDIVVSLSRQDLETEADGRGIALIHLIEKKIIELP